MDKIKKEVKNYINSTAINSNPHKKMIKAYYQGYQQAKHNGLEKIAVQNLTTAYALMKQPGAKLVMM